MRCYLLVDFGSTYTKLTAVDLDSADVIATAKAVTTVETDITHGYELALAKIHQQLSQPITFENIIACSSAAGGLKMAAIGLVEELTTEAAKRVCLGAGAKVELVLSHHINKSEVRSIIDKKIDIILLAGGANGGNQECVIYNAHQIAKSPINIPIIYAGNKDAIDEITDIFTTSDKDFYVCENVMPKLNVLNIESAKEKIKDIFVKNIIEAKGIKKIEKEIDQVILPTPHAVLMAAELLSKGYLDERGLGDLMMVDIGGATTDVYSLADGLPKTMNAVMTGLEEPYAKRTVEGDLGMRYSALGIIQSMKASDISRYQKEKNIDLVHEANKRNHDIAFIPKSDHDHNVEDIFASKCVDYALSRHVGTLKSVYTPMGMVYHQVGKDLSQTNFFIGTGGAIINSKDPVSILSYGLSQQNNLVELRPKKPQFMLDKDYILSAMGLLSIYHPDIALRIMKKRIIII